METTYKREGADVVFWSCRDPEELTLESPEEAIVEMVDLWHDGEGWGQFVDVLASRCPLTVTGYARDAIDIEWVAGLAERAVEMFEETINDEYGNPDGDSLIDGARRANLEADIAAAFRAAMKGVESWRCERAEARVYTADEVEAICRAECPEWFDVPVRAEAGKE